MESVREHCDKEGSPVCPPTNCDTLCVCFVLIAMCWLPAQGKAKIAFYKLADDNDGVCFEWIGAESIIFMSHAWR